jgi:hypothetical protein
MCHAQTSITYLKDQGLRWTSKINIVCYKYILFPVHNFFTLQGILKMIGQGDT